MMERLETDARARAERRVEVALREMLAAASDLRENIGDGDYSLAIWSAQDTFNAAARVRNACIKAAAL